MSNSRMTGNEFYQNYFHTLVVLLVAVILIMLVLVLWVMYQTQHRPLPQFIAVATNGQQIQLIPRNEPSLLTSTILKWATKAAIASYTYDFVNADKQLAAARHYFTDAGWQVFSNSITNLIQSIKANQLFVNGVVSGPPVISNQGEISGRGYVWRVQMPFLVTYQSADTVNRKQFYLSLTIVKVPTWKNPAGIGIDQFVM